MPGYRYSRARAAVPTRSYRSKYKLYGVNQRKVVRDHSRRRSYLTGLHRGTLNISQPSSSRKVAGTSRTSVTITPSRPTAKASPPNPIAGIQTAPAIEDASSSSGSAAKFDIDAVESYKDDNNFMVYAWQNVKTGALEEYNKQAALAGDLVQVGFKNLGKNMFRGLKSTILHSTLPPAAATLIDGSTNLAVENR